MQHRLLFFQEIKDGFATNYSESKQKVLFQDIRFIDYTVRKPNVLYSYRLELNPLNMHQDKACPILSVLLLQSLNSKDL